MQSDGLNSALSPVVYGDIELSIKINTQKYTKIIVTYTNLPFKQLKRLCYRYW